MESLETTEHKIDMWVVYNTCTANILRRAYSKDGAKAQLKEIKRDQPNFTTLAIDKIDFLNMSEEEWKVWKLLQCK